MILDKYLDYDIINESFITGENINEIYMINEEFKRKNEKLDEELLLAEGLEYVKNIKNNNTSYILQEGVSEFFKGLLENAKKLWERLKAFFSNLFKSIAVAIGNINKSLGDIDKYLNKDFSNFEYQGHKWKPTKIHLKMCNYSYKMLKSIYGMASKTETYVKRNNIEKNDNANNEKDRIDKDDTSNDEAEKYFVAFMVGSTDTKLTIDQAKDKIKEAYGMTESTDSIKNFSVIGKENMIEFLKNFNKNKTLTDLQKFTDNNLKEFINLINDCSARVDKIKDFHDDEKEENRKDRNSYINNGSSNIKKYATIGNKIIANYDTLMAQCIACEKAKFVEYRSAISAAVRYKPKEAK